ncbi:AMP-binding protein [Kibdelosporangium aridum]|uniref:Amino acid adenylation domain-containing protein n=1 Tax=Kibdelosporangium aridum TaxID=2030 RepID=A0A1W2FM83_KIBAR|nr:AMP-binding protein [Kibdelosporangium aridum]SMD22993.1 amino acid adenylation domain-containing protein [Kibdelosporangium aridum]
MTEYSLYDWFARSTRRHPDAEALRVGDTAWTYRQLREAVEVMAARLDGHSRVGVLATRSPLAYIGYLAALCAGSVVVPLNPRFPVRRNNIICREAGVSVIIADVPHELVCTDGRPPSMGDVAYLLFTSGSTGRPKGIAIRHRNVSAYVAYNIERYQVRPGCRLSQTFDLTFDPSVFDLFVAWGAGATVVVPQRDELNDPVTLVNREGITHWFSVPSVVSLAARMRRLPPGSMPGLRWSLFAGEQLTMEQARAWSAAAPGSVLENLYGPTELTVTCTAYRLAKDAEQWPETSNRTVPIGHCYPHLDHLVLDAEGRSSDDGELCVRGVQRFDGYLDERNNIGRFVRYDTVAASYEGTGRVPDDVWYRTGDRVTVGPDGSMVHRGRLDNQVQVHGYRVELGEIEAALRMHPRVHEAVLLSDGAELSAVYIGADVGNDELARWLSTRLPPYMVPRTYTRVDELPLNHNGKIDRKALVG